MTPGLSRPAAVHPWMGQPLASLPEPELRAILGTLESVAFGEAGDHEAVGRGELQVRIRDLDVRLEIVRPAERRVA